MWIIIPILPLKNTVAASILTYDKVVAIADSDSVLDIFGYVVKAYMNYFFYCKVLDFHQDFSGFDYYIKAFS